MRLTEMVFDLEQEHTELSLDEYVEKTTEDDPVFVDKIIHGALERMASKAWGNTIEGILRDKFKIKTDNSLIKDSTQMYIRYEDAMQVVSESLFQYHYLISVQEEMDDIEKYGKENGSISDE